MIAPRRKKDVSVRARQPFIKTPATPLCPAVLVPDPIDFPPTYKYTAGTDEYDTRNDKKVRITTDHSRNIFFHGCFVCCDGALKNNMSHGCFVYCDRLLKKKMSHGCYFCVLGIRVVVGVVAIFLAYAA